jgi:hypothetical protein
VGTILERSFAAAGHDIVVLTRRPAKENQARWDGATLGPWASHIDGCDVVVNLAGPSHPRSGQLSGPRPLESALVWAWLYIGPSPSSMSAGIPVRITGTLVSR